MVQILRDNGYEFQTQFFLQLVQTLPNYLLYFVNSYLLFRSIYLQQLNYCSQHFSVFNILVIDFSSICLDNWNWVFVQTLLFHHFVLRQLFLQWLKGYWIPQLFHEVCEIVTVFLKGACQGLDHSQLDMLEIILILFLNSFYLFLSLSFKSFQLLDFIFLFRYDQLQPFPLAFLNTNLVFQHLLLLLLLLLLLFLLFLLPLFLLLKNILTHTHTITISNLPSWYFANHPKRLIEFLSHFANFSFILLLLMFQLPVPLLQHLRSMR